MSAAMSTMMALCEKSDNDIRSCLNTLQVGVCVTLYVHDKDPYGSGKLTDTSHVVQSYNTMNLLW